MRDEVSIPLRGPRIFVSYSFSNDSARDFEQSLLRKGFRPTLIDNRTLLGQPSLSQALARQIEESDYVVPLIDSAAENSEWVQKEIEIALKCGVSVIPVLDAGIEPAGILDDIPCIVGGRTGDVATSIFADHACLRVDQEYLAHIRSDDLTDMMSCDRPPLFDSEGTLTRGLIDVVNALVARGFEPLTRQTLAAWRSFDRMTSEFIEIIPVYRATLQPFLDGYHERAQSSVDSWNALSRLFIGKELLALAGTSRPEDNNEWGELQRGAERMLEEWEMIDEADSGSRHVLWGIGKREREASDWHKDRESPLGHWNRVLATLHDGRRKSMIIPAEKNIQVGVRLREPANRYLKSWHWLNFILPQLAYYGLPLSPELGPKMIQFLEPD